MLFSHACPYSDLQFYHCIKYWNEQQHGRKSRLYFIPCRFGKNYKACSKCKGTSKFKGTVSWDFSSLFFLIKQLRYTRGPDKLFKIVTNLALNSRRFSRISKDSPLHDIAVSLDSALCYIVASQNFPLYYIAASQISLLFNIAASQILDFQLNSSGCIIQQSQIAPLY